MIQTAISFLGPWTWWVLGILLAIVEIFAPGTFFIWFAIAALVTGTLALTVTMAWQVQALVFVGLAVALALVGRRVYGRADPKAESALNDRVARLVGRSGVLDTALADGTGHMRIDDTQWRVEGPDLPAGTRVRITGFRDGRLQVAAE